MLVHVSMVVYLPQCFCICFNSCVLAPMFLYVFQQLPTCPNIFICFSGCLFAPMFLYVSIVAHLPQCFCVFQQLHRCPNIFNDFILFLFLPFHSQQPAITHLKSRQLVLIVLGQWPCFRTVQCYRPDVSRKYFLRRSALKLVDDENVCLTSHKTLKYENTCEAKCLECLNDFLY